MKTFRNMMAWILILMMLFATVAQAQELEEEVKPATYTDAVQAIEDMIAGMTALAKDEPEEEVAQALSGCALKLLEVQLGFMELADDGSDKDQFAQETLTSFTYSVEPAYIDRLDYVAGFDITREDSYIRIESEAFEAEGEEQLDYLRFEIAHREDSDETMLLFTFLDCAGLMTSSNRYLIHKTADSARLLYSRTFGTTVEYRIDLNEWAKGTDYTWEPALLYPAVSES